MGDRFSPSMAIPAGVAILLFLLSASVHCSSSSSSSSADEGKDEGRRREGDELGPHLEKYFGDFPSRGLDAAFRLSKDFIRTFTGQGVVAALAQELGIDLSNTSEETVTKLRNLKVDPQSLLPKVIKTGAGYVILFVAGIVLSIFFLLSCCCLFCCRKAGCCCGKVAKEPSKRSASLFIVILVVVVLLLSLMLLLASYGSAASGMIASRSVERDEETGLPFMRNLVKPLRGVFEFIHRAIKDIDDALVVDEIVDDFRKSLPDFSAIIERQEDQFKVNCTSCGSLIVMNKDLRSKTATLVENLDRMGAITRQLETDYDALNSSLTTFKRDLLDTVSDCWGSSCSRLRVAAQKLQDLRKGVNLKLPNLDDHGKNLREIRNYSLEFFTSNDFTKETEQVANTARPFVEALRDQLNKIPLDRISAYEAYLSPDPSKRPASATWDLLDKLGKHVPTFIKAVALMTAIGIAAIILLNLFGILLGPLCRKNSPRFSEKVFIISSYLSFCLGFLFCIVIIPLLLGGSILYREVCLDVKKGADSTYFKLADSVIQSQIKNSSRISHGDVSIIIKTENVSIFTKAIYGGCKNNESILRLMTENLVVEESTIEAIIRKTGPRIKKFTDNLNLTDLPIFSDEMMNSLKSVINATNLLGALTFNDSMPVIAPPLSFIKQLMEESADEVQNFEKKSRLRELRLDTVPELEKAEGKIQEREVELSRRLRKTKTYTDDVLEILDNMTAEIPQAKNQIATINLTEQLLATIKENIRATFWRFLNRSVAKLEKTARCRDLYDSFDSVIYGMCDLIVDPMNALWFCLGIVVVLLIPGFLAGLWLGGLYSRKYKRKRGVV